MREMILNVCDKGEVLKQLTFRKFACVCKTKERSEQRGVRKAIKIDTHTCVRHVTGARVYLQERSCRVRS